MTSEVNASSWDRLAVVVRIVRDVAGSSSLGKKKLQKLIHLAQEASGIATDYRFSFYTYGAFSAELAADIDRLDFWKALAVTYDADNNAYSIAALEDAQAIEARSAGFLAANDKLLKKTVSDFGSRSARDLELLSTLIFLKRRTGGLSDDKLIDQTVELKPHFKASDAQRGIQQLSDLGYWS